MAKMIDLTIRCAMQDFDDRAVECPLSWTVLELKQHLSTIYATKPVRFAPLAQWLSSPTLLDPTGLGCGAPTPYILGTVFGERADASLRSPAWGE